MALQNKTAKSDYITAQFKLVDKERSNAVEVCRELLKIQAVVLPASSFKR